MGKFTVKSCYKQHATKDNRAKFAFDEEYLGFTVLTGSSQILLLKKIRETMAGRIVLRNIYPFMFAELLDPYIKQTQPPLIDVLIREPKNTAPILSSCLSVAKGKKRIFLIKQNIG